jgi:hypothetical protein
VSIKSMVVGAAHQLRIRDNIKAVVANRTDAMTVRVEVLDINGNLRTGDNNTTITLSVVGGTATVLNAAAPTQGGVATFNVTSTVSGDVRFRAASAGLILGSAEQTARFLPGSGQKISLSVEPVTSLAADNVSQAQLVAKVTDPQGNLVTEGSYLITFTKTMHNSATVMPSQATVATVGGVARLTVTATSNIGTESFVASSSGLQSSGTVSISTRITGVAKRLSVQSIPAGKAGDTITVRVHVLDDLNQLVTGATGRTVTLMTSSATARTNGPQTTVNGIATFALTSAKEEFFTVTASSPGLEADLTGRQAAFTPGSPARIVLSASPPSLSADGVSRSNIRADLADAFGNRINSAYLVSLTLSDTRYGYLSSSQLYSGSLVQFTASTTPGAVVIGGASSSYPVAPVTLSTYVAGSPARVIVEEPTPVIAGNGGSGSVMEVRVKVVDSSGNVVTNLHSGGNLSAIGLTATGATGTTTTITSEGAYGLQGFVPNGTTTGTANAVNGVATFQFTNTKAETVTFTPVAFFNGVNLAASPSRGITRAGPINRLSLEASRLAISASGAETVTVTASLVDLFGNLAPGTNDSILFTRGTDAYLQFPPATRVETSSGQASILLASLIHSTGGPTTISAVAANSGASATITVTTDALPNAPTVYAADNNGVDTVVGPGDLGARVTVYVSPRNTTQTITVFVNGVAVPLYAQPWGNTPVSSISPGGTSLTAYINKSDLGGFGLKEIKAISSSPVGVSPMSNTTTVTVAP